VSGRVRHAVFLASGAALGLLLLWAVSGLSPFGQYPGPYGTILNRIAVPQRHVTDVVAAVTFDYRGFDTLGEEFILFVAVSGTALLLRTERGETDVEPQHAEDVDAEAQVGDALHALCYVLVAPIFLLGIYVVTHGHLTPGGGFQGGTILASALVMLYLGGEFASLKRLASSERTEMIDAVGAGGYVVVGLAGLIATGAFLQNIVPLGPIGELYSAGTIPYINLTVGLEVGGGLLLILSEFLRQTLQVRASAQAKHDQSSSSARENAPKQDGD
jgi:multicomponent Na+:H+ antiporter subunit B